MIKETEFTSMDSKAKDEFGSNLQAFKTFLFWWVQGLQADNFEMEKEK